MLKKEEDGVYVLLFSSLSDSEAAAYGVRTDDDGEGQDILHAHIHTYIHTEAIIWSLDRRGRL